MASSNFEIGDAIRFSASFTDSSGDAADPTTVVFRLRTSSDGAALSYDDGSTPPVVKSGTGGYYIDLVAATAGVYYWRWEGSGNVQASIEDLLLVNPSRF